MDQQEGESPVIIGFALDLQIKVDSKRDFRCP